MVRILGNHYVVQTPNPGQIRAVFPQAKVAEVRGQWFCAVPYSLDSARVLNNLGFAAPGPIRTEYAFEGKYKPMAHQIVTADFLALNPRAYVLSGMGTSKTLTALWAADYLQKKGIVQRTLVVAPLSTLDPTWGMEIFRNFPMKRYAILHGSRKKRHELLATDQDIYIVNHDGVEVVAEALMQRPDINLVIYDELATARTKNTNRWKVMNELLNKCGFERMAWGLTGAPTPNAPTDAFAQSKLITPERYKGHFTTFKNETMYQVSQFKWIPRRGAEDSVNKILKPSIRYALADCVDLPETTYSDRYAPLTPEQAKHYKQMLNQAVTEIRGNVITAVNAGVLLSKILQVSVGCPYDSAGETQKIDYSNRLSLVKELIEECDQKVLVFVPFTGALQAIATDLRKHWSVEIIDGSTSMTQRNETFRRFRSGDDPRIIVANAAAMSHGLTLTEASMIIWYAPTTSNDVYNQANARIVRPGQKHKTSIVHIYATPEEQRIYAGLREKTRLQDLVLELAKRGD